MAEAGESSYARAYEGAVWEISGLGIFGPTMGTLARPWELWPDHGNFGPTKPMKGTYE